jgi:hypothetical protein
VKNKKMALSNKWKICLWIGAIVVLYTIFICTKDRFTGFYWQYSYDLVRPTEAYTECLAHPPQAEKRVLECNENGRLASQWVWWMALKSTITSFWICNTLFCGEYYGVMREIAMKIFGFIIFAVIVFGLVVAYKRKSTKKSSRFDPDEDYSPPIIPYKNQAPIVLFVGDMENGRLKQKINQYEN